MGAKTEANENYETLNAIAFELAELSAKVRAVAESMRMLECEQLTVEKKSSLTRGLDFLRSWSQALEWAWWDYRKESGRIGDLGIGDTAQFGQKKGPRKKKKKGE